MKYFKTFLLFMLNLSLFHAISQNFNESRPTGLNSEVVIQRMHQLLNAYDSYGRLSGSILFSYRGETVLAEGFGWASQARQIPNTISTSLDIGSVSKQFTAAAILKLVEEGKVGLETPINRYLDEYASKKWKKVTVHHLLTHTSGIPSLYQSGQGLEELMPQPYNIEMADLIAYFHDKKLLAKPGKKYRYSNSGYVLLAAIIEKVCGTEYDQYLQETFFQPLNMEGTYWPDTRSYNDAQGHLGFNAQTKSAEKWSASWAVGAGGWFSSVLDLEKWRKHIHSDHFLTPDLRATYFAPHIPSRSGHYGYGWEIKSLDGKKVVSHDGATLGFVSQFIQIPEDEIGVFVLLNQTHDLDLLGTSGQFAEDIAMDLLALFHEKDIEIMPQRVEMSDVDIQAKEGTYAFEENDIWKVQQEGTHLIVEAKTYSPIQLPYYQNLPDTTEVLKRSYAIAEALKANKIGKMARHCDPMMKALTWFGVMKLGYKSIIEDRDQMLDYHIYQIEPLGHEKYKVTFRAIFEEDQIDFQLYFNEKGKLQGIFDGGYYVEGPKSMELIPVGKNQFLLYGFPYGDDDLLILFNRDGLALDNTVAQKLK